MTAFTATYSGSIIKSIQRGTIAIGSGSTSATATISNVVPGKTVVHFGGFSSNEANSFSTTGNFISASFPRVTLTNATTVTATREYGGSINTLTVEYCVVEYN